MTDLESYADVYAPSIINALRGPLMLLTGDLHILMVNESFCDTFRVVREEVERCSLCDISDGEWNVQPFRGLLERVLPTNAPLRDFEIECDSRRSGHRTMLVNAQRLIHRGRPVELILLSFDDVTERRQLEGALRLATTGLAHRTQEPTGTEQGHLATIVESSDDAILSRTIDGVIVSWNGGAERLFGHAAAEAIGRHVKMLVPPEGVGALASVMATVAEGDSLRQQELTCVRKDGSRVPVVVTVSPIRDREGHIVGAASVVRDVTVRKSLQTALIESEAEYRATFDDAPVGMAHTDLSGRWTRVNQRLQTMLGYSMEQLHATDFTALTHPDDLPHGASARERLIAGEIAECVTEKRYRRADGSYVWANLTLSLHRDSSGTPKYCIAIVEDIAERKQAQQELDHIFNLSPDMICACDYDGYLTRTNATWTQTLGYTAEQLQQDPFVTLVHPDDRDATMREFARLTQGEAVLGFTNRYRTMDGSYRWVEWHAKADPATRVIYAVARDQSDRRLLEHQLQQSQKMDAVGRLAGGVAHDFNNIVTIIAVCCDFLLARLKDDKDSIELVGEIKEAVERSAQLTQQLLAFSRKQALAPKVLDLNKHVSDTERMLRRTIGEDIRLTTVLRSRHGRVMADPGQLDQVLVNLAINARDAMPLGGQLTIETKDLDVDESDASAHPGLEPGPYVLLAVTDSGIGMSKSVKDRIFEPFFTVRDSGKGTGLGLAMVHGFIKQSGGSIEVDSEEGVGTSFTIYLPQVQEALSPEERHADLSLLPRGDETVFIVEDEASVRSLARQILEECGYRVLTAGHGEEALRVCAEVQGSIDLLVTDVIMPGMSGPVVAGRLQALYPAMEVLYVSGYTDDAVVLHGIVRDQVNFLHKPFSPAALACKVREVLTRTAVGGR